MAGITDRVKQVKIRHDAVLESRREAKAELKLKKEQLAALVEEMRAAGVDPETLDAELQIAEENLKQALDRFEVELEAAEAAFKIRPQR